MPTGNDPITWFTYDPDYDAMLEDFYPRGSGTELPFTWTF